MIKNLIILTVFLFSFTLLLAQSKPIVINLSSSDVSINSLFVHKTATKERVEGILGKNYRIFSYGKLGESFIYDSTGLAFRWDSTGKKLLSIFIHYDRYGSKPYYPQKAFKETISCIGMNYSPDARQLDLVKELFHLITKSEKDWSKIEIDKPKFTLVFDYFDESIGFAVPRPQSLAIYFRHDTLEAAKPMNLYVNTNADARGEGEEWEVFINNKNAKNLGYENIEVIDTKVAVEDREPTKLEAAYFKDGVNEVKRIYKGVSSEKEINSLGYRILGMKKYADAVEIFQLNVTDYPESFNAYDSLGEAQYLNNEAEKAFMSFQKAISLNPNSSTSQQSTYKNSQKYLKMLKGEVF